MGLTALLALGFVFLLVRLASLVLPVFVFPFLFLLLCLGCGNRRRKLLLVVPLCLGLCIRGLRKV